MVTGRRVEIACDESGFTGGNLVGGATTVFAHASVEIDPATADDVVGHVRARTAAPTSEMKAGRLLRSRPTVAWLLGPDSPVHGRARVHLTDTTFFVLARLLDVLVGGEPVHGRTSPGRDADRRALALTLYREGPHVFGRDRWQAFLVPAGNVLRTNNRWLPREPVPSFFAAVDALAREADGRHVAVAEALRRIGRGRPIAEATRAAHRDNPKLTPLMEPVVPAFRRTVESWGAQASELSIVHDEQSALTPERVSDIASDFMRRHPGHRVVGVRLVNSKLDSRVQVADLLAGAARRLAGDLLAGRGDDELLARLGPHVDAESTWADQDAWSGTVRPT